MNVDEKISKSAEFIRYLDGLIDGLETRGDKRHRFAGGSFCLSSEHHKAIVLLIYKRIDASAFALARPMVEAFLRGIWLHRCATGEQWEKVQNDDFPRIRSIAEDIETLEGYGKPFTGLLERSLSAFHSYTHGGLLPISRHQKIDTIESNYSDEERHEILDIANQIGFLSALNVAGLAHNNELMNNINNYARGHDLFPHY